MAETGRKAAQTSSAAPTATELAVDSPQENPAVTEMNNPEPSDKAGFVVRCGWPNTEFYVPDLPVITSAGTPLTKTQLSTAEKAAEASGVTLHVEEVN